MYNDDIATMIKIGQFQLFKKRTGKTAAETGRLFKQFGVFDYIDDAYEFLHIQGASATYEDIESHIRSRGETT
ncbi:MAG: DUF3791 domain-containing protein [Clostridiales Family XIII bacterium]|jgi:hypothetical protein|nr:DUF3791 domain-containing protein [Clostridiales Family XIII bacterium]